MDKELQEASAVSRASYQRAAQAPDFFSAFYDRLFEVRPDTRQLLSRPERTRLAGVLHLLHQLEVDGNARRRIRPEEH